VLTPEVTAIETFQKLSALRQPGLEASRGAGRNLALKLREPHYWDSPDALNLCDLTPSTSVPNIDGLRLFLQNTIPKTFLDDLGRERRDLDEIMARAKKVKEKDRETWFRGKVRSLRFRDLDAASPGRRSPLRLSRRR
jgi:hypothetical protein